MSPAGITVPGFIMSDVGRTNRPQAGQYRLLSVLLPLPTVTRRPPRIWPDGYWSARVWPRIIILAVFGLMDRLQLIGKE